MGISQQVSSACVRQRKGPGRASPCAATTGPGRVCMFDGGKAPVGSAVRKWRLALFRQPEPPELPPRRHVGLRSTSRTHRKPMLLFRFSGSFLFRFDARTFLGLLFQDPPRNTFRPRSLHERELAEQLLTQLPGIPVLRVADPRVNSWPDLIPADLTFSERPLHHLACGGESGRHSPGPAACGRRKFSSREMSRRPNSDRLGSCRS